MSVTTHWSRAGTACLIDGVEVTPDGRSVTVDGHEVANDEIRELERELGRVLYERRHVGRAQEVTEAVATLRDPELDATLAARVPHETVEVRARLLEGRHDGRVLVRLYGARVWVSPDRTRPAPDGEATVYVRLPSVWPALSPGFLLAKGTRLPQQDRGGGLARVYVHVTDPEELADVWETVVTTLHHSGVPWKAKVASAPGALPRRDAVTAYVDGRDVSVARAVVDAVADRPGLGHDVSPFALRLGRGTGLAWEPDDPRPGRTNLSFGQHRASVLASALLENARRGHAAPSGSFAARLEQAWDAANVDPRAPWRNKDSPPDP